MFRKTISLITLAALMVNLMGLTGCTSMVRLPIDKIDLDPPKKVTRLKLKDGGYVSWNTDGVVYVGQAKLFDGIAADGQRLHTRLSKVDSVYFVMGEGTPEQAMDAEGFHQDFIKKREDSVRGEIKRLIYAGDTVEFADNTARIDTTAHAVVGVTKQGDAVSVPLDQVHWMQVRRSAPGKTTLLVLGIGALGAVIALCIAFATTDIGLSDCSSCTW